MLLENRVIQALPIGVSIEGYSTDIISYVALKGIKVIDPESHEKIAEIEQLSLHYSMLGFIRAWGSFPDAVKEVVE